MIKPSEEKIQNLDNGLFFGGFKCFKFIFKSSKYPPPELADDDPILLEYTIGRNGIVQNHS